MGPSLCHACRFGLGTGAADVSQPPILGKLDAGDDLIEREGLNFQSHQTVIFLAAAYSPSSHLDFGETIRGIA
jgi:hypothetical protein